MGTCIKWIQGNELRLAIPLQKVTITQEGKVVEPYIPQENEKVVVELRDNNAYWGAKQYAPISINDNVVVVKDDGTLAIGIYDVTILIYDKASDKLLRRSKWKHQIIIFDDNAQVLDEFDDFPDYGSGEIVDAAIFFFAKGDKGDPGTTNYNELENKPTIPSALAELTDDESHRTVSDTEKTTWNNKANVVEGKVQAMNGFEVTGDYASVLGLILPFHDPSTHTTNGLPVIGINSDSEVVIGNIKVPDIVFSYNNTAVRVTTLVMQGLLAELAYQKPQNGIPASDIANGVIPDVSQFITKSVNDLVNYYTKGETYTQSEVNALIGSIQQFHYEIYPSLQDITTPATNVLYLIGPSGSGSDKYEEYVYANSDFQKIGDTSIDLSNYITTQALNAALHLFAQDIQTELNNYALKSQIKSVNGNSLIGSGDVSIHPEIVNLTDGEHSSGYYEDLMRTVGTLKLDTPQIFIYTAYNNNHIATTAMCFSTCTNTETSTTNAVIKQTLFLGTYKSMRTLSNTISDNKYQVVDNWAQIIDVKQSDLDVKLSKSGGSMTGNLNLNYYELQVNANRNGIKFENNTTGVLVGNGNMNTTIQSGNADLKHRKGSTDYNILDTSNVKTVNGNPIYGSGDIDTKEVFVGKYLQTSYKEISLALFNFKSIWMEDGSTPEDKFALSCNLGSGNGGYVFYRIKPEQIEWFVLDELTGYSRIYSLDLQSKLTFDNTPTANSNNPVKSSGIKTALDNKQDKIDNTHKLNADFVDDSSTTHKFVTTSEKTTWNNKQDSISDLGTIRANASGALQRSGGNMTGDLNLNSQGLLVRSGRNGIKFTGTGTREGVYVGNPNMRLFLEADAILDLIHKKGNAYYTILDEGNTKTINGQSLLGAGGNIQIPGDTLIYEVTDDIIKGVVGTEMTVSNELMNLVNGDAIGTKPIYFKARNNFVCCNLFNDGVWNGLTWICNFGGYLKAVAAVLENSTLIISNSKTLLNWL